MEFVPFFHRHDDIARHETRAVMLSEGNEWELPAGEYGFVDSFCSDDVCDCRKAMIAVYGGNPSRVEATIGYGWESATFYAKWLGDEDMGRKMAGSYLELGAQQFARSHVWLRFWKDFILADKEYRERLRRHYRIFKNHN